MDDDLLSVGVKAILVLFFGAFLAYLVLGGLHVVVAVPLALFCTYLFMQCLAMLLWALFGVFGVILMAWALVTDLCILYRQGLRGRMH